MKRIIFNIKLLRFYVKFDTGFKTVADPRLATKFDKHGPESACEFLRSNGLACNTSIIIIDIP